ncbi:unnamed protein product [Cochlearia groenlandica]
MDSYWNSKFVADPPHEGGGAPANSPSSRTRPIYPWTLDQPRNSLGKDESMNFDDFLKNICNFQDSQGPGLPRQNSITLPPILSQKDEEVFKYIIEEEQHTIGANIPQIHRQQALRDNTLEELLIRAGVKGNNNNLASFREPISTNHDGIHFAQPMQHLPSSNLKYQPQELMMPKPHVYGYGTQVGSSVNFHGNRSGFMGNGDQNLQEKSISLVPRVMPLHEIRQNNGDSLLVSPSTYIFRGGNNGRGRESYNGMCEKLRRRKIKNRESAARSRARKQIQDMDLEAQYQKLKKENQELLRKQAKSLINIQERPERKLRRTQSDIK